MPLYEYRCENDQCAAYNHVIEIFKAIIDRDAPFTCAICGVNLTRVIGATSFRMRPLAKD